MKYLGVTVEVLMNSLILAFVAAMIRVMFSKIDNFSDTIKIFIGSILFGIIAGYILNDIAWLKQWLKGIVVLFAIFGKELYMWGKALLSDPSKTITLISSIFSVFQKMKITFNPKDEENDTIK